MATNTDLYFYEGDDHTYTVKLTDSNGLAINITGYTFYFTVKRNKSDSDVDALFKKTVTSIAAPTTGVVNIDIDRTDTLDADYGTYYYDIKYKDASGEVTTIIYGKFTLIQAITDVV